MTVQPHANRPSSHFGGCVGFWLWALAGAALVLGFLSLGVLLLVPGIVLAVFLARRSTNSGGGPLLGLVAGAGLPLLIVAALNWSDWHHRTVGDSTPNPFYWGVLGICLLASGIAAYEIRRRRSG